MNPHRERRRARLALAAGVFAGALGVACIALLPRDPELNAPALAVEEDPPPKSPAENVAAYRTDRDEKAYRDAQTRPNLAKKVGGDHLLRVIEAPERGSVYLVKNAENAGPIKSWFDIQHLEGPIALDPERLARLSKALAEPASYDFLLHVGCGPNWHVQVHLEKGDDFVDVLLCFSCIQVGFVSGGHRAMVTMGKGRAEFLALSKEVFPNDAALLARK